MAKNIRELSEQILSLHNIVIESQGKIREDIKAVREDVAKMAKEIADIKQTADFAKGKALANEQKITSLASQMNELSDRNRRANLILTGISEEVAAKNLEPTLREWLESYNIKVQPEDIERAHRLQGRGKGGAPRDVIIKFSREKMQQQIYKELKKTKDLCFRGRKVWPRQDYCPETLKRKYLMRPYAQKLYSNNVKFTWGYPASIIIFREGKRLIARNVQEAEELLRDLGINTEDVREQEMREDLEEDADPAEGTSERGEKRPRTESLDGTT